MAWLVTGIVMALLHLLAFSGLAFSSRMGLPLALVALGGLIGFPLMVERPRAGLALALLGAAPTVFLGLLAAVLGEPSGILGTAPGMLQAFSAWRLYRRQRPPAGASAARASSHASTVNTGS